MTTHPTYHSKPTFRLIAALGALTAFPAMSTDIYLPALPDMAADLRATPEQAAFTLSSFFFGLAIGQLIYGPWSDRVGRRVPLMTGVGVYVAASIACAFVHSADGLIALRFLQALGGAAGPVIARASVRDRFDPQDSARVLAYLGLVFGLAPVLGPVAGAGLLLTADWRGIFVMLSILGALIGLGAYFVIEKPAPHEASGAPHEPLRVAVAETFKDGNFVRHTIVLSLAGSVMLTYVSLSSPLFIQGYGFSPQQFSFLFALNAIGFVIAGQLNARLLRNNSYSDALRWATAACVAFAVLVFFFSATSIGGVWSVEAPLFFTLASLGFVFGNATAGGLAHQMRRTGMASSLMGTLSTVTASIIISIAGLLQDGSPMPMASILLTCAATAALALRFGVQAQSRLAASSAAPKPLRENK